MKRPTSSQISAPSKLPIVTSNKLLLPSFFVHNLPLPKSRDFLACFIIEISFSVIVAKTEAQANASFKKFFGNGWVKIHNVKRNKTVPVFIVYIAKP